MMDDRKADVEAAYDGKSEDAEVEMNTCPECGHKFPASNAGGASVGGGS